MARSVSPTLQSLEAPCLKCGSTAFTVVWIAAADDTEFERDGALPYDEAREHLSTTCKNCGYVWPAAPLDSLEAP